MLKIVSREFSNKNIQLKVHGTKPNAIVTCYLYDITGVDKNNLDTIPKIQLNSTLKKVVFNQINAPAQSHEATASIEEFLDVTKEYYLMNRSSIDNETKWCGFNIKFV